MEIVRERLTNQRSSNVSKSVSVKTYTLYFFKLITALLLFVKTPDNVGTLKKEL